MGWSAPRARPADRHRLRWPLWLGLGLVALLAFLAMTRERNMLHEQAGQRLQALAELRRLQVTAWLSAQVAPARFLAASPLWAALAQPPGLQSQDSAAGQAAAQRLLQRAVDYRRSSGDVAAMVLDAQGQVWAAETGVPTDLPDAVRSLALQAMASGQVLHSAPYWQAGSPLPLRLDLVIPLQASGRPARAAVLLRLDPQLELLPLLQGGQLDSDSAEAGLWRRDGDTLLALSNFKRLPNAAGQLRRPLQGDRAVGLAGVVRGERPAGQVFAGLTYDQRSSWLVALPVGGTDWWLTARIDRSTVDAPVLRSLAWISLAALAMMLALGLLVRQSGQRLALQQAHDLASAQRRELDASALLRAVVDTSSDSIFAKDLDHRLQMINRAGAATLGRPPAQLLGLQTGAVLPPAQAGRLRTLEDQVLHSGQPITFEHPLLTPVGQRTFLATLGPLRDAAGQITGLFGMSRDITELAQLQADLQHERAHLTATVAERTAELRSTNQALNDANRLVHTIADNLPGRIVYLDAEQRCRYANRAWYDWYGRSPETTLGRLPSELVPQRDDSAWAPLRGVALAGQAQHFERADIAQDGTRQWAQVHCLPDWRDGVVVGLVVMAIDSTEQKQAADALREARDAAEAASRAKSAFLANTSHEIRTPLNGLLGLARMLQQPDLPEVTRRDYLDQMLDSAESLSGLISDILDLSKIEAGRLTLEAAPFGLRDLLTAMRTAYLTMAHARGLAFRVDVDNAVPAWVVGDVVRTRQILANFLTNALKFTEAGAIRMRVLCPSSDLLRIEVIDTGPGIALSGQARLFEPFTQADESTTRRFGGTGLGLSICRELATLMGGTVGVHSAVGEGSTFWAELPLVAALTPPPLPARTALAQWPNSLSNDAPQARLNADLQGLRVLMVEDHPVNMMIAVAQLEQWEMEVAQASNGEQAVHAIVAAANIGRPFDVVLMDVQMPVMSGHEATRLLRRSFSAEQLPIIALTAAALISEREEALAAGMNDFLTKPIDAPKLRQALVRWSGRTDNQHARN